MSKLLKVLRADSTTALPWKSFGGKLGGGLERTGETWKLGLLETQPPPKVTAKTIWGLCLWFCAISDEPGRIQIFPGGVFHVCNWRLLAGRLPQWLAVRSRYEGHMQQQQFIDGQVQDKVHTGQATGSGCSLVNPNMQQISIKDLRTLGKSCHNH